MSAYIIYGDAAVLKTRLINPTKEYEHTWFGKKIKIAAFGCPHDFAQFKHNRSVLQIIAECAQAHGINKVFAPSVRGANKCIADCFAFGEWFNYADVRIFFGVEADGVEIPPHSAFFIAPADCPTLVIQFPCGRVIATHAGRDCLLDRSAYIKGSARADESVIFSAFKNCECDFSQAHASVFCGICPEHFTHPTSHHMHGTGNKKMIEYICNRWSHACFADAGVNINEGKLNLFALITAQLKEVGCRTKHIWHDGTCVYSDIAPSGRHLWWSHRRGGKERNGLLVMRLDE